MAKPEANEEYQQFEDQYGDVPVRGRRKGPRVREVRSRITADAWSKLHAYSLEVDLPKSWIVSKAIEDYLGGRT